MECKKTLVSIIVPIFNGEDRIERCVSTLTNQTLENIEILLINDGSNDNTVNIIEDIKKTDKRIRIINKENTGVSDTRNVGIKNARGKYIGFVDIDDYVDIKMFEKLYKAINNKDIDMSICKYFKSDNQKKVEETWATDLIKGDIKKNFMLAMIGSNSEIEFNEDNTIMGSVWRCMYSRNIIQKNNILFDYRLSYAEDLIFNLEYMSKCKSIDVIEEPLYFYDISEDSLSTKYRKNLFDICKTLIHDIKDICKYNDTDTKLCIEKRLNFTYFKYAITSIRNSTEGLSVMKCSNYKYIKKIINDDEIGPSLQNINVTKLNNKFKFFYILFKYRVNALIVIFWVFKRFKLTINKIHLKH